MTSRDFCFWLQGLFELGAPKALSEEQTKAVKLHLDLVFKHEIAPAIQAPPSPTVPSNPERLRQIAELQQCGVGGRMIC